ncbi:hypothetical protein HJG60_008852 [Phyllostomus discolor]|uniref:Uncharacterized protein n=1 Tax=Phyllostomus discolor TaxID=89673 RepID=A0A834DI76_9CHIR|nr:hypothetical protein HJG60_008852 [Phyllostomus discolor]
MGALIEPWRPTVTSRRNLRRSVGLCHTPWLPCSGIVGILLSLSAVWKEHLEQTDLLGAAHPRVLWAPSFPLLHQPGAWGRGVCSSLFGFLLGPFTPLCHRCLAHRGQCESRVSGAAHTLPMRDGRNTGGWGLQVCSTQGREGSASWTNQLLELQAEVSQVEQLV